LESDALLKTLHQILENVLQTVDHFEISCLGAPFSCLEKPRDRMGRDLNCMADVVLGFYIPIFSKPNKDLWSGVHHENLIVTQSGKKFPAFYGTRKFISVFTGPF
jgi:hypothetical protein